MYHLCVLGGNPSILDCNLMKFFDSELSVQFYELVHDMSLRSLQERSWSSAVMYENDSHIVVMQV